VLVWPDRDSGDAAARAWAVDVAGKHPELLRLAYFTYARGDWGVGSDLDLVDIVDAARDPLIAEQPFARRAVRYDLSALPVPAELLVYTRTEWAQLQAQGRRFARTLAQEAIWIYQR
jgi:hypothetical protein